MFISLPSHYTLPLIAYKRQFGIVIIKQNQTQTTFNEQQIQMIHNENLVYWNLMREDTKDHQQTSSKRNSFDDAQSTVSTTDQASSEETGEGSSPRSNTNLSSPSNNNQQQLVFKSKKLPDREMMTIKQLLESQRQQTPPALKEGFNRKYWEGLRLENEERKVVDAEWAEHHKHSMATSFDVDVRTRVVKRQASVEFIKTEKAIQESYETIEQYRSIIRNIDNHCNEQLAIIMGQDAAVKRAVDVRRCGRIVQAKPMV